MANCGDCPAGSCQQVIVGADLGLWCSASVGAECEPSACHSSGLWPYWRVGILTRSIQLHFATESKRVSVHCQAPGVAAGLFCGAAMTDFLDGYLVPIAFLGGDSAGGVCRAGRQCHHSRASKNGRACGFPVERAESSRARATVLQPSGVAMLSLFVFPLFGWTTVGSGDGDTFTTSIRVRCPSDSSAAGRRDACPLNNCVAPSAGCFCGRSVATLLRVGAAGSGTSNRVRLE
eukprot:809563-Alexandrium_andersonii.AAC.1